MGIMPRTTTDKRRRQSIDAQFALAERVLRGLNKSIDEQADRARDLEVEHARTLLKSGRTTLHDAKDVIDEARRRIG